jgi:hypothetical protein
MEFNKDTIELNGAMSIVVFDSLTKKIKQEIYYPNLVVTAGKTWVAGRILGTGGITAMTHMGIGTNSTAAVIANTTLGTECSSGYTRAALSTATSNANVITFAATFLANNPNVSSVLREAAIFTASTGGTMLCRSVYNIVTKEVTDALSITWTVTMG